MAEPFWYVDSPLTTPDPRRPFAGRPPRGQAPPPGPGVLLPEAPVAAGGHVRALARAGFLLLTCRTDVSMTAPCPVRVLALDDVDPDGTLTRALGARPGEVWVVRPDAHIAAVLSDPTPDELSAALGRAMGEGLTSP